jgi:hypothetical protein
VNPSGDHEAASHRVRGVLADCSLETSCGGVNGARSIVREGGANKRVMPKRIGCESGSQSRADAIIVTVTVSRQFPAPSSLP